MGEIENTILIFLIVFIIGLGTFFGSVGTSSSANDTNITNNSSNSTNNTTKPIQLAASGISPQVSISVTSPVDLGTKLPDGLETSYSSIVQVNATGSEWLTAADDHLNLYVRSSGDFSNGSYTIPINNLKYNGFSNSTLAKTSFTTTNALVRSWALEGSWLYRSVDVSVTGNYYMTVPLGTTGGVYTTNIYYTAIIE